MTAVLESKPKTFEIADLVRCPKCGGTDTYFDIKAQVFHCNTCRTRWAPDKTLIAKNKVEDLSSQEILPGAKDVVKSENDREVVTLKCQMCHAEITLALSNESTIKCHWCRHTLSLSNQIQNGINPDGILPFTLTREKAEKHIDNYLKRRRFFALPKFVKEFSLTNMYPIYLPYLVVDVNAHSRHEGQAAHLVKKYSSNKKTYYNYDTYAFVRDFDLTINDLTIEANSNYTNHNTAESTQNVINAIMPFDTRQLIPYSPQFLQGGFRSEKRNLNIADLEKIVKLQFQDISRHRIADHADMKFYNHGIRFVSDQVDAKGSRWATALLPIWLYSYLEVRGGKQLLHYICVNGRTGETCGSVPINKFRLLMVSIIVEIMTIIVIILLVLGF